MAEASYSGTPLIKKSGIKPGRKILVLYSPKKYFELHGVNISDQYVAPNQVPDLIHFLKKVMLFLKRT